MLTTAKVIIMLKGIVRLAFITSSPVVAMASKLIKKKFSNK